MSKRGHLVGLLAVAFAIAGYQTAGADENQTQTLEVTPAPAKLPKARFVPLSTLRVVNEVLDPDSPHPSPMSRNVIDFDDDIHLEGLSSVPLDEVNKNNTLGQCPIGELGGHSYISARNACSSAIIGTGTGRGNLFGTPIPSTLTEFAGAPQGKHAVVLVHSDPGFDAFASVGVLQRSPLGGDFGQRLDFTVPDLQAGAAIELIDLTTRRSYRFKGKRHSIASARCHDKNRRINSRGSFYFDHGALLKTADFSVPCQVKKPKNKKG